MQEMIGQQMIIGIEGLTVSPDEEKFISQNGIGGVILFSRNFESLEQLHELVMQLQRLRYSIKDKVPLFISADMEGGRVQRFKDPFTVWPPMGELGKLDSSSLCFQFAKMMGDELKSMGINMNYSPCIDVLFNKDNEVIGDRALSSDPGDVAKLSSAIVRGFIKADIIPVAKHFPGHGMTVVDSHFDLPVDTRGLKELEENGDLEPFKKVIKSRIDMLMTAHIKYPNIDPQHPVTLSSLFLKNFLRDALRFRGIIMTDDLDMKALTRSYSKEEIPVMALEAGANILLYCNEPKSPQLAVQSISRALSDQRLSEDIVRKNNQMVLNVKKKKLKQPIEPFSLDKVRAIVGCDDHKGFVEAVRSGDVERFVKPFT